MAELRSLDELSGLISRSTGEQKIDYMNAIVENMMVKSIDSASIISHDAIEYSKAIGYSKGLGYAYINYARCIVKKGYVDSADYYFKMAIEVFNGANNREGLFDAYSTMGRVYTGLILSEKAIASYIKSMDYIDNVKDPNSIVKLYSYWGLLYIFWDDNEKAQSILSLAESAANKSGCNQCKSLLYSIQGKIHYQLRDLEKGLYYYEKMKNEAALENDQAIVAAAYWLISSIYTDLNQHDSARYYLDLSYSLAEKEKNYELSAICLTSLGHIASKTGDYRRELNYSRLALRKRYLVGDIDLITSSYINIGNTYLKLGKSDSAIICADSAKSYTNRLSTIRYAAAVYSLYYRTYQAMGDFEAAKQALLRYSSLKDTLINQDVMKYMAGLQVQFESQQRDKQIAEAESDQQWAIIISLCVFILISIISIIFLKSSSSKKRQLGMQLNAQKEVMKYTADELKLKKMELEKFQNELEFRISDSTADLEKEIAERKKAEILLMESEEKYRTLVDNIQDGTYIFRKGKFYFANHALSRITGIESDDFVHKSFFDITHPDDHSIVKDMLTNNESDDESDKYFDFRLQCKSGGYKSVIARKPSFVLVGNEISAVGSISDITHYREIEKQLQISVQEKESLINEIHLRVKNNLMIISNLLYSQSKTLNDEQTSAIFSEAINRIRSIAVVHERLYLSDKQQKVLTTEYIQSISNLIFSTYDIGDENCHTELEIDEFLIDIEKAIPVGLIINELVSNSFKYALSQDKQGFIRVALKHDVSGEITLEVSDNGTGLPDATASKERTSFGLQLINLLVSQLHGQMVYLNNDGAHFIIKFSL